MARPSKEEVRSKIVEEAKRSFMEMGYDRMSMRSLGKQIGMSQSACYIYFKDKEDIFNEVLKTIKDPKIKRAMELEKKWSEQGILIEKLSKLV